MIYQVLVAPRVDWVITPSFLLFINLMLFNPLESVLLLELKHVRTPSYRFVPSYGSFIPKLVFIFRLYFTQFSLPPVAPSVVFSFLVYFPSLCYLVIFA